LANIPQVFYAGAGKVCAVTDIHDMTLPPNDPAQTYKCEGTGTLNDPYEGELFTWWLYFFGGLSANDKVAIWVVKRPQLVSVEYKMGGIGPITVQEGRCSIAITYTSTLSCSFHINATNQDSGSPPTNNGKSSSYPTTTLTSSGASSSTPSEPAPATPW
jgi:hypothetical protein